MLVLWWIPAGHIPTVEEAKARLDELGRNGPTAVGLHLPKALSRSGARRLVALTAESREPPKPSEEDVVALTALINEAYSPAEGFLYEGPRITAEEVRKKLDQGRFLLERDANGVLRGCVHVAITGDAGYFGLLAVSPAGQGRGRGRSLVRAAESFCLAKGCRTMSIDVVDSRHELLPFYARLGYEVVGERPFDDPRLNRPSHFVVLRKVLDPDLPEPSPGRPIPPLETAALTVVAMLAFATNSLLCRAALAGGHADAASFTTIRLAGGALVLGLLVRARESPPTGARLGWGSAVALFVYALAFSLAYLRIAAGVGALLMFAAVQLTMIGAGLRAGERPRALEWVGSGLVGRWPRGADPAGARATRSRGRSSHARRRGGVGLVLAARATKRGCGGGERRELRARGPAGRWARARSWRCSGHRISPAGALLALASGALASGLGYAVWYAALRGLSATRAAIVQLSVPPLAAAGGVLVLGESFSARLVIASVLILGGIALAVLGHARS